MITFTTALVLLVLGYVVYGAFVERVFGADASRKTPCYTMADGVVIHRCLRGKSISSSF